MKNWVLAATFGVAIGVLATTAEARPHDQQSGHRHWGYDQDSGQRHARNTRNQRKYSTRRSRKHYAKGNRSRSAGRRSSFMRSAGAGTSRGCLTSAARGLLGRIEAQFGKMQIISTCRPGARIAGTGRISKHASGNAIDFNAGSRKGAVVRWLIANHKRGGTMTYSGMSHVHVDIGPRFVSLGAGGRG